MRVGQIRTQLSKFIKRWKVEETSARENVFPVLKAITAGLFPNAAILRGDGLYETVRDAVVLQGRFLILKIKISIKKNFVKPTQSCTQIRHSPMRKNRPNAFYIQK